MAINPCNTFKRKNFFMETPVPLSTCAHCRCTQSPPKDAAKAQSAKASGSAIFPLARKADAEPISRKGRKKERSRGEVIKVPRTPIKAENKRR